MSSISGFKVLKHLNKGAYTNVYNAIRLRDRKRVILKILEKEHAGSTQEKQFQNDYKIRSAISNDCILKAYELINHQGRTILVMEDYGGYGLKRLKNKHFSILDLLVIFIKSCEALHVVHSENIIHKDIKTENIIYNPSNGKLKLAGFGIATYLKRVPSALSSPNQIEGTLAYISPEQTGRMNRSLDYRSDIYSLGITFYEMFTQSVPFASTNPLDLIQSHISREPLPPHRLNSKIPPILSKIILKCLSKTAEDRYQEATGLKHDLDICYRLLIETGNVAEFEIGANDQSERFQIPEKLYGRKEETARLMNIFDSVAHGKKEIIFLWGDSGIGKSRLINELHKPIVREHGFFIAGSFDPYMRNVPYSAIIYALRQLVGQLLMTDGTILGEIKEKIKEFIGPNVAVITNLVPEFQQIIGEHPSLPPLPLSESQNRFKLVFSDFINILSTSQHPLALFIDDIQWADNDSILLIESLLADYRLGYFLFVGASRGNETDVLHPLILMQNKMKAIQLSWENIELQPLTEKNIGQILLDTLNYPLTETREMASLIFQKTQGNPLFLLQLLNQMHRDGIFQFKSKWTFKFEKIQTIEIPDDFVHLIAEKIKTLPPETQLALKAIACTGLHAEITLLNSIFEEIDKKAPLSLLPAINDNLILESLDTSGEVQWVHEAIWETVYSLINENEREHILYCIGRTLLGLSSNNSDNENIFKTAHLLNKTVQRLTDEEKTRLIHINITAGEKAKTAEAFTIASIFFQKASQLLPPDAWYTQYSTKLSLLTQWAEAELMSTHYESAEPHLEHALTNAKSLPDKLKVFNVKLASLKNRRQFKEAVDLSMKMLKELGLSLPESAFIDDSLTLKELETFKQALGTDVSRLTELEPIKEPNIEAVVNTLVNIMVPAKFSYPHALPYLLLNIGNLTLAHGLTVSSAFGLSFLASILCTDFDEYELGFHIGKAALAIQKNSDDRFYSPIVQFYFFNMVSFWKNSLDGLDERLMYVYRECLETGNLQYAGDTLYNLFLAHLYAGFKLPITGDGYDRFAPDLLKFKKEDVSVFYNCPRQLVEIFMEKSDNMLQLNGKHFNEQQVLPELIKKRHKAGIGLVYFCKLYLICIMGDFKGGLQAALDGLRFVKEITDLYLGPLGQFFAVLILLKNIEAGIPACYIDNACDTSPIPTAAEGIKEKNTPRQRYLQAASEVRTRLHLWMENCPENFLHLYRLLSAEMARVEGNVLDAMSFYDEAVKTAGNNGFIQIEALASEFTSLFWLERGRPDFAEVHIKNAYDRYAEWGATAKTMAMKKKYKALLRTDSGKRPSIPVSLPTNPVCIETVSTEELPDLDLPDVIKVCQSISSEIHLKKLLINLIDTAILCTGARYGLLLLEKEGIYKVEARRAEKQKVEILNSLSLNQVPMATRVIRSVIRTHETVVIDDALQDNRFNNDKHITQKKPKSILCVPLLHKSHPTAILYLENNLKTGAFTSNRLEMLNLLATQAAISIENALLYSNLEQKEAAGARKLAAAQKKIISLKKDTSCMNMVGSFVHEMHNTLSSAGKRLSAVLNKNRQTNGFNTDDQKKKKVQPKYIPHLAQMDKTLQQVLQDTQRALKITGQILEYSCLGHSVPGKDSVMLEEVVRKIIEEDDGQEFKRYGILVRTRLEADIPLTGDETHFYSIVKNLLFNARDALIPDVEKKSDIQLPKLIIVELSQVTGLTELFQLTEFADAPLNSSETNTIEELNTTPIETQKFQVLTIQDNGVGIPTKHKERIFEPFFSSKPDITNGLGLDVAKKFASFYDGKIDILSREGYGTRCVVTFPVPSGT